jgi:hypothetical protein
MILNIILALLVLLSVIGLITCAVALRNRVEYRNQIEEIHTEIEEAGTEARELWKAGCPAFHRAYARVEALAAEKRFLEDLLRSSWF